MVVTLNLVKIDETSVLIKFWIFKKMSVHALTSTKIWDVGLNIFT